MLSEYIQASITCECGLKIALSQNLKDLGRIIEAHASAHGLKETNPDAAEAEFGRIQDILIEQVFDIVSKDLEYRAQMQPM
jgi:hypothetical protein